jgi:hypothetical protein
MREDHQDMTIDQPQTTPEVPATQNPPRPTNIIEALARCMTEIPGIGKDQEMHADGQKYRYRGIESITAVAQRVLGRNGVVIVPKVEEHADSTYQVRSGNEWHRHVFTITYRLFGPGGVTDVIEAGPFIAIANDPSDKGSLKAMTQAFKQMLLQVLCIGDNKDDPDSYSSEMSERGQPPTPDEVAVRQGWESALDREDAKAAARAALSGRTDTGDITRERAAELFREYQRPDGPEQPPRLRTKGEHLAWWAEHSGAVDLSEDNPLDPPPPAQGGALFPAGPASVPAAPPQVAQEPPQPAAGTTAPEAPPGPPEGNGHRDSLNILARAALAAGGDGSRLIEEIRDMPVSEVADRLGARGLAQPSGTANVLRRRLAETVLREHHTDHPAAPPATQGS